MYTSHVMLFLIGMLTCLSNMGCIGKPGKVQELSAFRVPPAFVIDFEDEAFSLIHTSESLADGLMTIMTNKIHSAYFTKDFLNKYMSKVQDINDTSQRIWQMWYCEQKKEAHPHSRFYYYDNDLLVKNEGDVCSKGFLSKPRDNAVMSPPENSIIEFSIIRSCCEWALERCDNTRQNLKRIQRVVNDSNGIDTRALTEITATIKAENASIGIRSKPWFNDLKEFIYENEMLEDDSQYCLYYIPPLEGTCQEGEFRILRNDCLVFSIRGVFP